MPAGKSENTARPNRQSLFGKTTIEPQLVTLRYGTGEIATRTSAPTGYFPEADQKKTDIEKAFFAHHGQSMHKVRRPFYEINDSDAVAVDELCQYNLNNMIRETNR
jgi:hypothetical protein